MADSQSKSVFFITPNLANGGAERVTAVLANHLCGEVQNVFMVFMKDRQKVYSLERSVQLIYNTGSGNKLLRIIRKIHGLRCIMKQNREAAFVAMLPYETLYTFIAGIGLKVKKVYSLRNDPYNMKGSIYRFINKIIYPRADRIVFQTEEARDFYPSKIREKGCIIENPVRTDLPEPFQGKRKPEFVSIGRLDRQKNFPLLLRSFSKVHAQYPEWKLKIYGKGPLKDQLIESCEELNISHAVEFCGFVDSVIEKINASGCFVLSSDYEGISNAMLEALSSGVPCICTDCPIGGARMSICSGNNGLLVPVRDEKALTESMIWVIEHPEEAQKMADRALQIKERLSPVIIAKQWKNVLF